MLGTDARARFEINKPLLADDTGPLTDSDGELC